METSHRISCFCLLIRLVWVSVLIWNGWTRIVLGLEMVRILEYLHRYDVLWSWNPFLSGFEFQVFHAHSLKVILCIFDMSAFWVWFPPMGSGVEFCTWDLTLALKEFPMLEHLDFGFQIRDAQTVLQMWMLCAWSGFTTNKIHTGQFRIWIGNLQAAHAY